MFVVALRRITGAKFIHFARSVQSFVLKKMAHAASVVLRGI